MMRILLVCHDLGRGGTQRAVQVFAQSYRRAGHAVAVLAHAEGGPRAAHLARDGIPTFVGDADPTDAIRAADAFAPDIVHIHRPGMANAREAQVLQMLRRADRRVMETNVFARVDYSPAADLIDVHCHISNWSMWRWQQWLGRSAPRAAAVLPNPVEPADFPAVTGDEAAAYRASLGIPTGAFVCGRVGQALVPKWHPQNILAFDALARVDPDAYLVLRGLPPLFQRYVDALPPGVRRRVTVLGLSDSDRELSQLYGSLDCFLHAAQIGESFGLVLTEAMLAGCAVVTASRPFKDNGHVEVVGHLRGGVVAASLAQLPAALRMFRGDRELQARVRRTAREWVLSRYRADQVAATAIRIATWSRDAADRAALIRSLEGDPTLKTHVDDAAIAKLLAETYGKPSAVEMFEMQLVHQPWLQRAIARYLQRR